MKKGKKMENKGENRWKERERKKKREGLATKEIIKK